MREIDLIPGSYRRQRSQKLWLKAFAGLALGLIVTSAVARAWLGSAVNEMEAGIARLQAQQTVTSQERDLLATMTEDRRNYQEQLYLLRGLRSGAAATDLFGIIDQALVGDELWFKSWDFRRAGVTDAEGQAVETGYFVVVSDTGQPNDSWRVETHMTIAGQATDHAALSEFVQRLLGHPEIENVHVRRTELSRYATRSLVDFDLAVVINRQVRN